MTKPKQIIELEKHLGFELWETKNIEGLSITFTSKIYYLNEKQVVIGLNLCWCRLTDLAFLKGFSALTHLYLSSNKITDIRFLEKLTSLTSLDLSSNKITDIRFLEKLTSLTSLYLSFSKITDIRFLEKLTSLTSLDLGSNKITDIRFLEKLISLTSLDLSFNQITDIRFLEKLISLTSLDLSFNQITCISLAFIRCFPRLYSLNLYNNPIQNIPKEIFDKSGNVLEAVKNYLEDIEKGSQENKEIKVVFIGNGNVGKTQVARRLVEQDKFVFEEEHKSTHAVVLLRRELSGFDLNCWDFAGQDIYHATHRLFLQTRALFVLVWDFENEMRDYHELSDGKKYNNEKLRYWLEYAQCFAPESPILVVRNKADKDKEGDDSEYIYFEHKGTLEKDYRQIVGFLNVSAKTKKGFKVLENKLKKIFETHQSFKTPLMPISWVMVRQEIRELQENESKKTLNFQEFQAICEYHRVEKSTETILDYLHSTGVLYYRKGYFQDQIIVQTDWAIQAVYKVLDRESDYFEVLEDNGGKLDYELICEIWADNTDDERALFVDFMLSAELAFETTTDKKFKLQDRSFIIPQLLPTKRNDITTWLEDHKSVLIKTLEYRFLPKIFIQRFIVKANKFSEVRLMSQDGILLQTTEGEALVVAVYEREKQRIEIHANNDFLVKKIIEELDAIKGEGKLKVKEGKSETDKERFGLRAERFGLQAFEPIKNLFYPLTHEELTDDIRYALKEMLDLKHNTIHQENHYNDDLASKLSMLRHKFHIKDQSRGGKSKSGKDLGERDITINTKGGEFAIIEALRLKPIGQKLYEHIYKLLNDYDGVGHTRNYIVSYYIEDDFKTHWEDYKTKINDLNNQAGFKQSKYPQIGNFKEEKTDITDIREGITFYEREGKTVEVYHFFVKMKK